MNSEKIKLAIGKWLIPAILTTVALQQIRLATTQNLSPWKGGGFGMFSSIDNRKNRYIKLYGIKKGKKDPLMAPYTKLVRNFPHPKFMDNYLNNLKFYEWTEYSDPHGIKYLVPKTKNEFRNSETEFYSYTYFCMEVWSFAPNKKETKYINKKLNSRCKNISDTYNILDLYQNEIN